MNDHQEVLDRAKRAAMSFDSPEQPYEALLRRRDRKRRNQRITAGVVGMAVFLTVIVGVVIAARDGGHQPAGSGTTGPSVVPPAGKVDFLLDLDTGEKTPLPDTFAPSQAEQGTSSPSGFAFSPVESLLAYVADVGDGNHQIFIAGIDGTGVRQMTHGPIRAGEPAWSPDGTRIAYVGSGPKGVFTPEDVFTDLFVLDVASGESTQVTDEVHVDGPTFTPDGSSIVYSGGTNHRPLLMTVPVVGGESTLLFEPRGGIDDSGNGSISPDGSLVTYLGGGTLTPGGHCGPCRFVANVDGSEMRVIGGWMTNPAGTWSPDGSRIVTGSNYRGGAIWVIDVATGEKAQAARGRMAIWFDNHTLLVEV